ncbi:MAG: HEAT repeat domain-containing protein, partial [Gemmataceae bacterium]|nr:HEAT repeat domain-containing protein [Gemmataceae bacterium]
MSRATFPLLLALLVGLACGCGQKPKPEPTPDAPGVKGDGKDPGPPPDQAASWRAQQLAGLKLTDDAKRKAAVDELSWLVAEDPEAGPALVEALKDKTASGRPRANRINTPREAAALALVQAGPKGEALLKDKGLAALREGLNDPLPAVREHTAYTLGTLGTLAKSLAGDVQKLCAD